MPKEEIMKTNKVTKLGVSLLSVAALGVVAPALIDVPVFGVSIVKADENQEPLKYRITYYDSEAAVQIADEMTGTINPGETINIYKNIDGYEITSKYSWMPNYDMTYDIANEYFYGSRDGYNDMFLEYKKVDADAKPSEEVKPETKPSDTPKPEVKPEPKPSDTPKPEVKPEPAPKSEERQGQIKIRIRYLDEHSREIAPMYTGVLNPGESVNIYKDIEGHQVVSNFSWMPGYNLTYNIASTYFYGAKDGYLEGYLRYKKLDPTPTPKPEVKPETKPSETPKPEVKPAPKPSEAPKPEVKPETKPSDTSKPEVKPETKPSDTSKPEVKPEPKPSDTPKPEVKPAPKPSETPKPVTPAVPDQPQPAKPEKPVTPSTSRILANEIGSVQVRASEETLKNVSYIKVEETKSNSLEAKNYKAYDIRLYDANGKAVQPNGMVLVSLSAEKPVENVYYVSPDGALQALDFKQDADKVTFETNHFSIYAMTFKNLSVNHNNGSIQTPVAGSENQTTPTQNSNGADGTQPQSKPLKTKGEGGEKTSKTLPNTGENSSILTTLFGVLTLNAGLFSYRKKEK